MAGMAALALVSCDRESAPSLLQQSDWLAYKEHFIADDGRVLDNGQGQNSHSESQGYGMLLAVAFDDRETFQRVWQWTRTHLQVRNDYLFAWLWSQQEDRVADENNATDGDLMIAWALQRAARHWSDDEYRTSAEQIVRSLASLQIKVNGRLFLLPGKQGFYSDQELILNPSHFVLPAFRELSALDQRIDWSKLYDDALALIRHNRYSNWQLVPDWVDLKQGGRPWSKRKAYFSYDAMRIPLFAAWVGAANVLSPYVDFWRQFSMREKQPDIVDLQTGFVHLRRNFSAVDAIKRLCEHVMHPEKTTELSRFVWNEQTNYYDASLYLLSRLAWHEFDLVREGEG